MKSNNYENSNENFEVEDFDFDEIMRGTKFNEQYKESCDGCFQGDGYRESYESPQFGTEYIHEYQVGYGEEYDRSAANGYFDEAAFNQGNGFGQETEEDFGSNGFGQCSFQGATGPSAYSNGRNRVFNRRGNVNGVNAVVVNRDFYNNFYNRYNNYYVKNQNINRDFVYDYNIVHVSSENYYGGCSHVGSRCCVKRGRCCRRRRRCSF